MMHRADTDQLPSVAGADYPDLRAARRYRHAPVAA